ncbi:MAG: hypothetical protein LBD04_01840, partial [Synergistaceae bacterium]|nr:hypothetical protein [Synergistaceae bacterium]
MRPISNEKRELIIEAKQRGEKEERECYLNNDIFKLINTCSTMIFKNNDTRVEKPYDTRICRNMIITWATLSEENIAVWLKISKSSVGTLWKRFRDTNCFLPKIYTGRRSC